MEWLKGTTEKLGKFGCVGQKFSDKLKVMSEKLEELEGLIEDLVKLSSTSQEFKETLNAALEKMEVAEGAMEDLVISVASDQQTIEMLCNQVDGVQTEAEARTKKVKDSFGIGKEESSACSATSAKEDPSVKNRSNAVSGDSDASKSYPMKLLRKFLLKFK